MFTFQRSFLRYAYFLLLGIVIVAACNAAESIDLKTKQNTDRELWQGDQPEVTKTYSDISLLSLTLGASRELILTSEPNVSISFPHTLDEGSGLQMAITGTIQLEVKYFRVLGLTLIGTKQDDWSESNPLNSSPSDGLIAEVGSFLDLGLLGGENINIKASNLKLHLTCPEGGCNFKELLGQTIRTPKISLQLKSGSAWVNDQITIIEPMEFNFISPCTFSVDPNVITFRTLTTNSFVAEGSLLDTARSTYTCDCGPNFSGAGASIKLTPSDGVADDNVYFANFDKDLGVVLVYGLTELSGCNNSNGIEKWNTGIKITDTLDSSGLVEGNIHWGLCARPPLQAGEYHTSVQIEAWVE